jgi:hypothetical protein
MKVSFSVSQASIQNGQTQLNVPHGQVLELLTEAKLPEDFRIGRKSGVGLLLTFKTPKGKNVEVRMIDTHSVWLQHQEPKSDGYTLIDWLYKNQGGELDLVSVKPFDVKKGSVAAKPKASVADMPI